MFLLLSLFSIFVSFASCQFRVSIGKSGIKIHGSAGHLQGGLAGIGGFVPPSGVHPNEGIGYGAHAALHGGDQQQAASEHMSFPLDMLYNANIFKSLSMPFEMANKVFPFSIRVATKGKPHAPTIQVGAHPFGQSSFFGGQPSTPLAALGENTHGIGSGLDSIGSTTNSQLFGQLFGHNNNGASLSIGGIKLGR